VGKLHHRGLKHFRLLNLESGKHKRIERSGEQLVKISATKDVAGDISENSGGSSDKPERNSS